MDKILTMLVLGALPLTVSAEPAPEVPPVAMEEITPPVSESPGSADQKVVVEEQEDDGADAIGEVIPWSNELLKFPEWRPGAAEEEEERPAAAGDVLGPFGGLFPAEVWPSVSWEPEIAAGAGGASAVPWSVPSGIAELTARAGTQAVQALYDPAGLLPAESAQEMRDLVNRWLNEQCAFRTVLILLPAETVLPADFHPRKLHGRWFGAEEEKGLLLLYFYGRPDRSLGVFSSGARETYGAERLRATLDSSAAAAARAGAGEPVGQLERFCQALTMDLHRMVKAGPLPSSLTDPGAGGGAWTVRILTLFGLLAAAGGGAVWWRRRRHQEGTGGEPILLPEMDYTPRLGAPHCGGFTAEMSFDFKPRKAVQTAAAVPSGAHR